MAISADVVGTIARRRMPFSRLFAVATAVATLAAITVSPAAASAASASSTTGHGVGATAQPQLTVVQAAKPVAVANRTLLVSGPGWAAYANAVLPNVKPVVITATTSPQVAADAVANGVGINCFFVACTLYIYRGSVKTIDNAVARYANASLAVIAGAFAIACAPLGGVGAVVCATIGAVLGGYAIDQFNYAAAHNQCIAVDFVVTPVPFVWNLHPDNGGNCHN